MNRRSESRARLYAIAVLISAVMILGTAGALDIERIPFTVGLWQICWSLALGLFGTYGIWLEETRAAKRVRRY